MRSTRLLPLLLSTLLWACNTTVPTTAGVPQALAACEIVSPGAGRPLDASDDLDPATSDIETNVQVRVRGAGGARVALELDGVGLTGTQLSGSDDSLHVFPSVRFREGLARLACTMSGYPAARTERTVAVFAACGLHFSRPALAERVSAADLHIDEGGRMVHSVVVDAKGLPQGTSIELLRADGDRVTHVGMLPLLGSAVRFEIPADVGAQRLRVRSVGAHCAAAADVTFDVAPIDCTARLTLPAVLNATADTSPAKGLQMQLCADTLCPNGASVTLRIDGAGEVRGVVKDGRACAEASIPEGRASILTSVVGARPDVLALPVRPCVDVTPPLVTVTSDLAGLVLRTRDDADPSSAGTMELPVTGLVTGLRESSCGLSAAPRVDVRVNNEVQHSFGEDGRDQSFERVARLLPGRNLVQVCATDAARNVTCSPSAEVMVRLLHPTLRFQRGDREWLLGHGPVAGRRDFDITLDGFELPASTLVRLSAGASAWSCARPLLAGGTVAFKVGRDCASLPDGVHHLSAMAIDADGNVAESPELVVHLDTLPPALRFRTLTTGISTNEARPDVTLDIAGADAQSATLLLNGLQVGQAVVSEGRARFPSVELAEGHNELVAEARDAAGNLGSALVHIVRDTLVPVPRIAGLEAGRIFGREDDLDGDPTNGAQIDLLIRTPGEADGAVVTLQVGGLRPLTATVQGEAVSFARVTLPEGDVALSVTARDAAGNVGVLRVPVGVRLGQPIVRFVAPADGAVLGAAADLDPRAPGLQVAVAVAVAESPNVRSCSVVVDAGTAAEMRVALVLDGRVCRGTLTLTEGAHALAAEVDAQGLTRSLPIGVRADLTAPRLQLAAPTTLRLAADPAGGLHTSGEAIVVTADDVEPGQLAALRVTLDGQLLAVRFAAFGADHRASFPGLDFSLPGTVTLEAQVADLAGNLSALATTTLAVVLAQ